MKPDQTNQKSNEELTQQAQVLQSALTGGDEEYYLKFEQYLQQAYYDVPTQSYYIRYYSTANRWYIYNPLEGVYRDVSKHQIKKIFMEWADLVGEKTTSQKTNHIVERLQAFLEYTDLWDSGLFNQYNHIINVRNGLLDTETLQLLPHTPAYMSRRQIPRWYISGVRKIPGPLQKVLTSTPDRDNLLKSLICVVKNRHEDEVFIMLYGQKHSGKSTTLQIFENIMGSENISKSSLFILSDRFGFEDCFDKLINIYPDLPICPMNSHTIGVLKTMTGNDGNLQIEIKGVPKFKYPIAIFFAFGTNQLPSFQKGSSMEMESLMRRACLIHYPQMQLHDPSFKSLIKDPGVLDLIFSYLVALPYIPLYLPCELEEWIRNNTEKWLEDSAPVLRVLKNLYFYCPIPRNAKGDPYSLEVRAVYEETRDMLGDEGYVTGDLQADITEAFRSMKIYRNNARGAKSAYLKIMRFDDPDAAKMQALIEKEEKTNPNANKGQLTLDKPPVNEILKGLPPEDPDDGRVPPEEIDPAQEDVSNLFFKPI